MLLAWSSDTGGLRSVTLNVYTILVWQTPLHVDDGAVFWMDPDDATLFEHTESIDVGQVTVKTGMGLKAVVNAQGRSDKIGSDWVQQGILFKSK